MAIRARPAGAHFAHRSPAAARSTRPTLRAVGGRLLHPLLHAGHGGHCHSHSHRRDVAGGAGALREVDGCGEGLRTVWVSVAVLTLTAVVQGVVVVASGSVALLGDSLHNVADALTALPLAVAFALGRRPPSARYTYGLSLIHI